MQNKKKTKYTLNVDDSRKSNTKNRTKVNKRIIIVGVIVVIAALIIQNTRKQTKTLQTINLK